MSATAWLEKARASLDRRAHRVRAAGSEERVPGLRYRLDHAALANGRE